MIRTGLLGKPWGSAAAGLPINASAAIVTMNANLPAADRPMLCAPSRIRLVARGWPDLRAGKIALNAQAKPWAQIGAEHAADERGHEPQPAVHAGGGDTAEIRADIAAIGETRAVAEHQPAEHGRKQRARRHLPAGIELSRKPGCQKRAEKYEIKHGRGDVGE